MAEIELMGRFPDIAPENLDEFKMLAREAREGVEAELGTLRYDWFLTPDERCCVVLERYADAAALLEHTANLGDRLQRFIDLGGGLEISGFGEPDPELMPLAEAMGASIYLPFEPQ